MPAPATSMVFDPTKERPAMPAGTRAGENNWALRIAKPPFYAYSATGASPSPSAD